MATSEASGRWLLLIHQIPPSPGYLRVKVSRRLGRLGAVAIKNSVYVLPSSDASREHFEWVLREIVQGGGDGSICAASFIDGLSDSQIEALFNGARDEDYAAMAAELRDIEKRLPRRGRLDEPRRAQMETDLVRLKRRLDDIGEIDFYHAPGRHVAQALIAGLERHLGGDHGAGVGGAGQLDPKNYRNRVWVTRRGIHVDRMSSAWLIRRFIDPQATFKFVPGQRYAPQQGDLRFDMFDGEFTHEGDLCTFEVLLHRMRLQDAALRRIGELVHDIDLKDGKFGRPETQGFELVVAAIALSHRADEERLTRISLVLDDLYELYRKKRS